MVNHNMYKISQTQYDDTLEYRDFTEILQHNHTQYNCLLSSNYIFNENRVKFPFTKVIDPRFSVSVKLISD